MKRKITGAVIVCLASILPAFGQDKFGAYNFSAVDSFALSVKYKDNIVQLARDLAAPYSKDVYKVRSIFRWITDNIAYDYEAINEGKEPGRPDCKGNPDCAEIRRKWEDDFLADVLSSRKAVCNGYAKLFRKLCEINNIKADIVPGYSKSNPYTIGNPLNAKHAWNAVMLDSAWYYLDATWAAGNCTEDDETGKLKKFVKSYKPYYWLTPYNKLVRNHYPKDAKWVEQPAITKEDFFNMPHYFGVEMLENISNEKPATGMLLIKKGDTLHFSFDYRLPVEKIQVNSNNFKNPQLLYRNTRTGELVKDPSAESRQVYIPFTKNGNTYSFDYIVTDISTYYLEILVNYRKAMRYRLRAE